MLCLLLQEVLNSFRIAEFWRPVEEGCGKYKSILSEVCSQNSVVLKTSVIPMALTEILHSHRFPLIQKSHQYDMFFSKCFKLEIDGLYHICSVSLTPGGTQLDPEGSRVQMKSDLLQGVLEKRTQNDRSQSRRT